MFFNAWREWSAPVLTTNDAQWSYCYPTAGASEGLREAINAYGHRARVEGFAPKIHVFEGEYEGFAAYAGKTDIDAETQKIKMEGAGIEVVRHNRANWREAIAQIGETDQFFISQPSAIDGKVWDDFDEFARAMYEQKPGAKLMLDLTYIGAVAKDFHINADHPNIPTVFFSLSKPFGVYYQRIGGVISCEPYPNLFGNKWFKHMQSMVVGIALLNHFGVHDLPRKFESAQRQALDNISQRLGVTFEPADVMLLGTAAPGPDLPPVLQSLVRGSKGEERVRLCASFEMAKLIPGAVALDFDSPPIDIPHLTRRHGS